MKRYIVFAVLLFVTLFMITLWAVPESQGLAVSQDQNKEIKPSVNLQDPIVEQLRVALVRNDYESDHKVLGLVTQLAFECPSPGQVCQDAWTPRGCWRTSGSCFQCYINCLNDCSYVFHDPLCGWDIMMWSDCSICCADNFDECEFDLET